MTTQADTETRNTVIGLVGNTPLLHLGRIAPNLPPGVAVYAKAEWANPGGSIKDRAALYMIRDGEQRALLRPGMRIADATSGNTGIAYATIGAALGYGVTLAMPRNATPERKRILYALGAELILTDPQEGMDEAIRSIRALVAANPDHYFYPDQYNNPANVLAHFETTAPEILQQTDGMITHFVAALGTCGTFVGTGHKLKAEKPSVRLIQVQPDGPYHALEGVKHLASTVNVPGIYDATLADDTVEVSSEQAFDMCRCLARVEGLMVGISAAANVVAALQVARTLREGVVVTILCDSAAKYLSEPFWNESGGTCVEGEGI